MLENYIVKVNFYRFSAKGYSSPDEMREALIGSVPVEGISRLEMIAIGGKRREVQKGIYVDLPILRDQNPKKIPIPTALRAYPQDYIEIKLHPEGEEKALVNVIYRDSNVMSSILGRVTATEFTKELTAGQKVEYTLKGPSSQWNVICEIELVLKEESA